jgi:hypothetical protein
VPTIAGITGRAFVFGYAVLLRTLAAVGGALTAYGATGMFTSGGLMPPNGLVSTGLLFTIIVLAALWSKERLLTCAWSALLVAALPYSLYALRGVTQVECAPPYQPITPSYSCATVGSPALAVVAPILTLLALVLLVLDLRVIAKRLFSAA